MKSHLVFTNPNEQLAQQVGITSANSMFKDFQNVKFQPFLFTWESFGIVVQKLSTSSLFMYYAEQPDNKAVMKSICSNAARIEWDNLVEAAAGTLPLADVVFPEVLNQFQAHFDSFYDKLKADFKKKYMSNFPEKASNWEVIFTQVHTVSYVRDKAHAYLNDLLKIRKFEDESVIRENITNHINALYPTIEHNV